jgi:hypothetical protein
MARFFMWKIYVLTALFLLCDVNRQEQNNNDNQGGESVETSYYVGSCVHKIIL